MLGRVVRDYRRPPTGLGVEYQRVWVARARVLAHGTLGASVLAVLLVMTGCMVGPDYHAPQAKAPGNWVTPTTAPTTQASVPTTQPLALMRWWQEFNDPTLDSLVERAMGANLDLRQAEARLREARAARGISAAGLYPGADANGSYRRSRSPGQSKAGDFFQAGFDASWELDIFGGTRRGVEAAEANIQAAVEDRRDVLVSLLAEVAQNYIDLRGSQREIAIAQENLTAQQKSADISHQRFAAGFVSRLDVANSEALVASTRSQVPVLEAQARQSIYNLSLLLGREPGALVEELSTAAPIPATPPEVPMGLPSDLLRRRPDIRRAEANLHAATARIGVATADLFPKFSLTGSLGTEGSNFSSLGNWSNRFWSIGPGINWPIFEGGRIRANIEVQNAIQEQALISYEQTVLTAFRDVESALVAYVKEQQHRTALEEATAANRQAVDLALLLYTQGQTDFLNVLSAQRSLYASQDALVQSDRTMGTNLVALYKALGGGWEQQEQRQQEPGR